jgi:hypothetical protein
MFTKKSPKYLFSKKFFLKKSYAHTFLIQKTKIRRLWSKLIFSLFLAKTFLENQKMDIYKCPKSDFPK